MKLTINETLAKSLGLYEAYKDKKEIDLSSSFKVVGEKAEKENFITFTKSADFKIELKTKEYLPEIMILFINMWKHYMMCLNNEQNRILTEFRDALLPKLMNGEIEVQKIKQDEALEVENTRLEVKK